MNCVLTNRPCFDISCEPSSDAKVCEGRVGEGRRVLCAFLQCVGLLLHFLIFFFEHFCRHCVELPSIVVYVSLLWHLGLV